MSVGSRKAGLMATVAVVVGLPGTDPMRQRDHGWGSVMADRFERVRIGVDHANRSAKAALSVTVTASATNESPARPAIRHRDVVGLGVYGAMRGLRLVRRGRARRSRVSGNLLA